MKYNRRPKLWTWEVITSFGLLMVMGVGMWIFASHDIVYVLFPIQLCSLGSLIYFGKRNNNRLMEYYEEMFSDD